MLEEMEGYSLWLPITIAVRGMRGSCSCLLEAEGCAGGREP